jgi:hypothetical protein
MSPRRPRARRTPATKRGTRLTAGDAVLGRAGLATAAVTTAPDHTADAEEARPARADTPAPARSSTSRRPLPRTDTEVFALLGVSWPCSSTRCRGTERISRSLARTPFAMAPSSRPTSKSSDASLCAPQKAGTLVLAGFLKTAGSGRRVGLYAGDRFAARDIGP